MMDKQIAAKLITNTFENPFDKTRFINFSKNLVNHLDESNNFLWAGNRIPNAGAFQPYINSIERVGKYKDEENDIDILIVNLKKESSLEHARTRQRNFVARYLDEHNKSAALVAFVSPNPDNWRFSLIKMEYDLGTTPTGRIKTEMELTPASRYSFLVGKSESSHTAQNQFLSILQNDTQNPSLAAFEKAFSVEVVTKEFFEKYKQLYISVKESLDTLAIDNESVKQEFIDRQIDSVSFAKKLLGQIVFLYFLQKKGWFGVGREQEWGKGPKDFLRRLFEKKTVPYQNFFNDILEPLFYEALAKDRRDSDDYYRLFNSKIPFLNGGLFDPINDYSWVHVDILLPNELFSNTEKTKEGDTGSGILDVFDRYNFTVKEDEPLDKEVAVDPEMLGKVFENLLEVKDRKSKGTYYTPREIVHYMCQESLINYLDTAVNTGEVTLAKVKPVNLKLFGTPAVQQQAFKSEGNTNRVPREDIEALVRMGDMAIEHDTHIENQGKETRDYLYKLAPSIRFNAVLIDDALAKIRVCDLAIGSGAFPVGMMTEIVHARNTLTTYMAEKTGRTYYGFKRHSIQNSIYGVDIDPSAVEIAKLRLWLSLVVDEDDIKQIQPLPNLDYQIVCGDSLLGVNNVKGDMFSNNLVELKEDYFNETNATEKIKLRAQIEHQIKSLTTNKVVFDFEIYFPEVFHKTGGFDVIIGNPPYVQLQKDSGKLAELYKKCGYKTFERTGDIYTLFYERGINLLQNNGLLCFITSNKWMRTGYGKELRAMLTSQTLDIVIDFCELPVFAASTDPCIILLTKNPSLNDPELSVAVIKSESDIYHLTNALTELGKLVRQSTLKAEGWTLAGSEGSKVIDKIQNAGTTLGKYVKGHFYRGILTGLNEAFVIDEDSKKNIIKEDAKSATLIKPWLNGHDILKWHPDFDKKFLIEISSSSNHQWPWSSSKKVTEAESAFASTYPSLYRHLCKFKTALKDREDQGQFWWELRSCSYWSVFNDPKIVFNETSKELHAFIDDQGLRINKTGFIILSDENEYLLGIMNSVMMDYYYRYNFPSWGDPWNGGRIQFRKDRMISLPIFPATNSQKAEITDYVKEIIAAKKHDTKADVSGLEHQINELVYKLYELTPEEIAVVEGKH